MKLTDKQRSRLEIWIYQIAGDSHGRYHRAVLKNPEREDTTNEHGVGLLVEYSTKLTNEVLEAVAEIYGEDRT